MSASMQKRMRCVQLYIVMVILYYGYIWRKTIRKRMVNIMTCGQMIWVENAQISVKVMAQRTEITSGNDILQKSTSLRTISLILLRGLSIIL